MRRGPPPRRPQPSGGKRRKAADGFTGHRVGNQQRSCGTAAHGKGWLCLPFSPQPAARKQFNVHKTGNSSGSSGNNTAKVVNPRRPTGIISGFYRLSRNAGPCFPVRRPAHRSASGKGGSTLSRIRHPGSFIQLSKSDPVSFHPPFLVAPKRLSEGGSHSAILAPLLFPVKQ